MEYRDTLEGLCCLSMHTMREVFARRIGRLAFGIALLVGVGVLATAVWRGSGDRFGDDFGRFDAAPLDAARIIAMTWFAAIAAGLAAWVIAARVVRWSIAPRLMRRSIDGDALFAESLMVPAAGIALLLPITLHLPVALLVSDAEGFAFWVKASLWITGIAHLVFAGMVAMRARQLVAGRPAIAPRKIYVVTVVTSCVPFIVLWAIPPVLVAITALPFLPILGAMERIVERERCELAGAPHPLPRAVAAISSRAG